MLYRFFIFVLGNDYLTYVQMVTSSYRNNNGYRVCIVCFVFTANVASCKYTTCNDSSYRCTLTALLKDVNYNTFSINDLLLCLT